MSKRPVKIRRQQRRIQALFKFFNFPPSRSRCQAALRKCRKIAPRLWSSIWSHAEATINAFPQLILGLFWVVYYHGFVLEKKPRDKITNLKCPISAKRLGWYTTWTLGFWTLPSLIILEEGELTMRLVSLPVKLGFFLHNINENTHIPLKKQFIFWMEFTYIMWEKCITHFFGRKNQALVLITLSRFRHKIVQWRL